MSETTYYLSVLPIKPITIKRNADLVNKIILISGITAGTIIAFDLGLNLYRDITNKQDLNYIRVPTLSINNLFIKSLSEIILKAKEKEGEFLTSSSLSRICPSDFTKCPCKKVN